jgi:hypothetical protein
VRSSVADKIKGLKADALPCASSAMSANNGAGENDLGVIIVQELEVEITDDAPTEAERKAVEDFFDWLLAEALRLAGEMGKAA